MNQIDIFKAAQSNSKKLEEDFDRLMRLDTNLSEGLKKILATFRVSTNKKIFALLSFLQSDNLESGYRYSENIGSSSFEETLRLIWPTNTPSKYIRRRVVFQQQVDRGSDHLFGALNDGNAGTVAKDSAYGEYCIVLKPSTFENSDLQIAYCKNDTLAVDKYWTCEKYKGQCSDCPASKFPSVDAHCDVNWDKLLMDYADHAHRAHLAIVKHKELGRNLGITPQGGDTEDYMEACFIHNIQSSDIESVFFHEALSIPLFYEAFIMEKDPVAKEDDALHISYLALHRQAEASLRDKKIDHGYYLDTGKVQDGSI